MCVSMQATEDDLTPEYREERDQLVRQLKDGLVPKEKNGECLPSLFPVSLPSPSCTYLLV